MHPSSNEYHSKGLMSRFFVTADTKGLKSSFAIPTTKNRGGFRSYRVSEATGWSPRRPAAPRDLKKILDSRGSPVCSVNPDYSACYHFR